MKELQLYYEKRDIETFKFKITLSNQLKERNSVKKERIMVNIKQYDISNSKCFNNQNNYKWIKVSY